MKWNSDFNISQVAYLEEWVMKPVKSSAIRAEWSLLTGQAQQVSYPGPWFTALHLAKSVHQSRGNFPEQGQGVSTMKPR